jgi:hypothetical protein
VSSPSSARSLPTRRKMLRSPASSPPWSWARPTYSCFAVEVYAARGNWAANGWQIGFAPALASLHATIRGVQLKHTSGKGPRNARPSRNYFSGILDSHRMGCLLVWSPALYAYIALYENLGPQKIMSLVRHTGRTPAGPALDN